MADSALLCYSSRRMTGDAKKLLKKTFGFSRFRPYQEEIVGAILSGRDLFGALPTGGGKSLCYQLPSLLLPGLTVVVSPLIALMEDQVEGARQFGLPAAYLNSSLTEAESRDVHRRLYAGEIKLLYASPERLANASFRERLREWGVSLFAIDEAHCISEWGHEFRPEYRNLTVLRREFADAVVAAFTATATPRVQEDVVKLLGLKDPLLVRGDFDRREIFYRVVRKQKVNNQIREFVAAHPEEPGIVYRATRRSVEETAGALRQAGFTALPYHAGLSDSERRKNQAAFVRDEAEVIVATIAFGMGIDKSNVRWVLHGDLPKSIEAYYQETGRCGRDGEDAETCLFFSPGDISKIRYHIDRMEVDTEREQAERNLREMLRFVDAGTCRRTQLLSHFGQEHSGECGRCDVCTGEIATSDVTEDAQKLLSAIYRTGERFGAHYVADLLIGDDDERMRRFGHHELPTFGVGSDKPKSWWLSIAKDMEAAGLLVRRDGERSGLKISAAGKDVLYGRKAFEAVERPEQSSKARARDSRSAGTGAARASRAPGTETAIWREDQERLFQCLRGLRKQLAVEKGIPPYMIFSDKSLKGMVKNRPETMPGLLRVHGVGERKAELYGAEFLGRIRSFLATGECPEG